jgi:hypothetical protein
VTKWLADPARALVIPKPEEDWCRCLFGVFLDELLQALARLGSQPLVHSSVSGFPRGTWRKFTYVPYKEPSPGVLARQGSPGLIRASIPGQPRTAS